MKKKDPSTPENSGRIAPEGLAQRMARYRAQLVAEGRMNAVKLLDSAVANSERQAKTKGNHQ